MTFSFLVPNISGNICAASTIQQKEDTTVAVSPFLLLPLLQRLTNHYYKQMHTIRIGTSVAEYSEEHIPGSININVLDEQFAVVADSTLRKDAPVALYCRSGKRSKKAAAILSKKGYTVYELDKGFTGWKQAGKETEK